MVRSRVCSSVVATALLCALLTARARAQAPGSGRAVDARPADAPAADAGSASVGETGATSSYAVPYTVTDMRHIVVRAKIDGRGPFNFIVDTGAPMLIIATAVARKLAIVPDSQHWGVMRRLELEGGLVARDVRCMVADAYQIDGMNRLGIAGIELSGIMGYTFLARYRIQIDQARPKMLWTPLAFSPPDPQNLESLPATLEVMSAVVKAATSLAGGILPPTLVPRGTLGIEVEDTPDGVRVKAIQTASPAARAGLAQGDLLRSLGETPIRTSGDLMRLTAEVLPGSTVTFEIGMQGHLRKVAVRASMGF